MMRKLFGKSNDESDTVQVDKHTNRPDFVWDRYKVKRKKEEVKRLPVDAPISADKIRVVCISDTHNRTSNWTTPLPDGDILLHCGDFTQWGKCTEVHQFDKFLGTLPHKIKLVIGGNHDLSLDDSIDHFEIRLCDPELLRLHGATCAQDLLRNCCYLRDSFVVIGGYKFYGAPWTPEYFSMGFNYTRGSEGLAKWNLIPADTDVLLTHGPALGYGDKTTGGQHVGCVELLNTVQKRVRPLYHVSGHIHESSGVLTDGVTTFINAAICDRRYRPTQPPFVFDLPLRNGETKEEVLSAPLRPVECSGNKDASQLESEAKLNGAMSDLAIR